MHAVKLAVAAVRIIVASAIKQATRKSAANPRIIKNIARFGLNEGTKTAILENDARRFVWAHRGHRSGSCLTGAAALPDQRLRLRQRRRPGARRVPLHRRANALPVDRPPSICRILSHPLGRAARPRERPGGQLRASPDRRLQHRERHRPVVVFRRDGLRHRPPGCDHAPTAARRA